MPIPIRTIGPPRAVIFGQYQIPSPCAAAAVQHVSVRQWFAHSVARKVAPDCAFRAYRMRVSGHANGTQRFRGVILTLDSSRWHQPGVAPDRC